MPTKKRVAAGPAVRGLTIGAFVVVAIGIAAGLMAGAFFSSDYFKVKEIIVGSGDASILAYLQGRNILSLDLERESAVLLSRCPQCKRVRITKILPDRLFVQYMRRSPAALVKTNTGLFCLDDDGTLFPSSLMQQESSLPVICGLENKLSNLQPGRRYKSKDMVLALEMIAQIRKYGIFKGYRIKSVNMQDSLNAYVIMVPDSEEVSRNGAVNNANRTGGSAGSIEIKLGSDNIKNKLMLLENLVAQTKVDIASINYVDMRFRDPVLKLAGDDKP
jgi:cell division septal protein FtsQ